jgi:undecaprenyl-diphosphatase
MPFGDFEIVQFFASQRTDFLNGIMLFFTSLASELPYLGFAFLIIAFFWEKFRKKIAFSIILGSIFHSVMVLILKIVIARERPPFSIIQEFGYSFPSGHAARAFFLATLLCYYTKNNFLKAIFFLLALIVSFSRIYLGAHFPSDVIAGALIGIFTAISAEKIADLKLKKTKNLKIAFTP